MAATTCLAPQEADGLAESIEVAPLRCHVPCGSCMLVCHCGTVHCLTQSNSVTSTATVEKVSNWWIFLLILALFNVKQRGLRRHHFSDRSTSSTLSKSNVPGCLGCCKPSIPMNFPALQLPEPPVKKPRKNGEQQTEGTLFSEQVRDTFRLLLPLIKWMILQLGVCCT